MATITFDDKDNTLATSNPRRLVRAVDLNEIKSVVNTNDSDNTSSHSSLSSATSTVATNLATHAALTNNPHSVTKTQVGLGNADNTSDADKPISTAQAAVNSAQATTNSGKQATLVSGTNIKTVNGTTILGSGDLTIAVTTFAENIIPTGTVNGSNTAFVLPSTPVAGSLKLYTDGLRMIGGGVDYTLIGVNITMVIAPVSAIIADYRI